MDHLVFYSSKFVLKLPVSTLLTLPHKFTGLCVQDMNMLVEALLFCCHKPVYTVAAQADFINTKYPS